jgi:Ser/Thr protein kinase RdoA (MazF antagonist)
LIAPSDSPYEDLTPDVVISAVESVGLASDGRMLALNSYENRVYQLGIEDGTPIVVKFYRPERWSTPAILEEHGFALELAAAEIPVVPPLARDGRTLFERDGFRFALFERRGGRLPELATEHDREWIGRFLGRIHAVGRCGRFEHRQALTVERLGVVPRAWLLASKWIPEHVRAAYASVSQTLLEAVQRQLDAATPATLRLHGDCHPGNVLWTDAGPHFVDLDDCMTGPAVQDLWMLLSGSRREMAEQLAQILRGYTRFSDFDLAEVRCVEALRSLRIMHYAAWVAQRYDDPAFPRAFPWVAEPRYWEQHVLGLREQLSALAEEPLEVWEWLA